MKEQFVTYEIALKLKELSFDEKCIAWYRKNDKEYFKRMDGTYSLVPKDFHGTYEREGISNLRIAEIHCAAPLWQQVIDWFREKHQLDISYTQHYYMGNGGVRGYLFDISNYNFSIPSTCIENSNFYKAREQAILKAIELCQK